MPTQKLRLQIGNRRLSGIKLAGKWKFICRAWPDLAKRFDGLEDATPCIEEFERRALEKVKGAKS